MELDLNSAASVLDAAWQSSERKIEQDGVVARLLEVRDGAGKSLIDLKPYLDHWRENPERVEGTAIMQTLESFVDLTKRHATKENSALFCDVTPTAPLLTAVIDYHGAEAKPRRCAHQIDYPFPLSDDWKFWTAATTGAAQRKTQGDFAFLIEDRIADLVAATKEENEIAAMMDAKMARPAVILTLSRGLQINVNQSVKEVLDVGTGEAKIVFEEDHKGPQGRQLNIPGMFVIAIPVFTADEPTRIPVRLRYRVQEGKTFWFMSLYRPDRILRDKIEALAQKAKDGIGLPLFFGSSEE